MANPTSDPPKNLVMSGLPKKLPVAIRAISEGDKILTPRHCGMDGIYWCAMVYRRFRAAERQYETYTRKGSYKDCFPDATLVHETSPLWKSI